jgi:hypothetical protein
MSNSIDAILLVQELRRKAEKDELPMGEILGVLATAVKCMEIRNDHLESLFEKNLPDSEAQRYSHGNDARDAIYGIHYMLERNVESYPKPIQPEMRQDAQTLVEFSKYLVNDKSYFVNLAIEVIGIVSKYHSFMEDYWVCRELDRDSLPDGM